MKKYSKSSRKNAPLGREVKGMGSTMKKLLLIMALLYNIGAFAQETDYKEYSYTKFFELIKNEKDSVFKLNDALIRYNPKTDQRFRAAANPNEKKDSTYAYRNDIVVDKHLELTNVHFIISIDTKTRDFQGVLLDIHFKKSVQLENTKSLYMRYSRVDQLFNFSLDDCEHGSEESEGLIRNIIELQYSKFKDFRFSNNCEDSSDKTSTYIVGNSFIASQKDSYYYFGNKNNASLIFENNRVSGYAYVFYTFTGIPGQIRIRDNIFKSDFVTFFKANLDGKLNWTKNRFSTPVSLELDPFSSEDNIDWNQFDKGFYAYNAFLDFTVKSMNRYPVQIEREARNRLIKQYNDSVRIYDENAFTTEISLKSHFYSHFKNRYNTKNANKAYIELKDLETERLAKEYNLDPSFRAYFKWKVNQFLKLFSDYGTEPSKAIVVSLYVILFFAFIYLFFPNSWDSHGRKRIVHRYSFFLKYMDNDAGVHEVYMDEQKESLLEFDDFKNFVLSKENRVPKIFIVTAIPLYKWAISGTKLSASFLKRFDIMKGRWSELPANKRWWKSTLLITTFSFAILYDIAIKMLNALMLSINTFTTLGFGEIPIKGLPRYLAIIQGFIGWFMLTIFSVSLISQLLN